MNAQSRPAFANTFSSLPFADKLVLWAVRLWQHGYRQRLNVQGQLHEGLAVAGLADMPMMLDRVMPVLLMEATTALELRHPHDPGVSSDEQLFLSVLAAWQEGDGKHQGSAILSLWLPTAAIRFVQAPLAAIADGLRQNNLLIRSRCRNGTRKSFAGNSVAMFTGSGTIH